ncbi:MAG: ATP-binding protein [Gammaproteobacteria bacterium]|nr:ATP-binding protein [Gammaproteobacteria bacterium]
MVLVMDELDTSLHPKMVRFLVVLLHNSKTNLNNAQLVGTSHDVTLMEGELFRRDQIWFVEKGQSRATRPVPLSDFSPRKGGDYERLSSGALWCIALYFEAHFLRNQQPPMAAILVQKRVF